MGAVCCLSWKQTFVALEEGVQARGLQSEGVMAPRSRRSGAWDRGSAGKGDGLPRGGPGAPASCR